MKPLAVLIVPDKLKGSLTAVQAAEALGRGWLRARPRDRLDQLPMADGGDGFGEVFGALMGAEARLCDSHDASGRPCRVPWWAEADKQIAVFETAQVNGLALLQARPEPGSLEQASMRPRHPFELDTFGVGEVLREIAASGIDTAYVGLGGSATNDGGFGAARALGFTFRAASGDVIERWTQLASLARIEAPAVELGPRQLVLVVDVSSPLLGVNGATYTYGPQKGLAHSQLAHAESCLQRLASVARDSKLDLALAPGAGAAGGLGFGLAQFAGGRFQSGAELFAKLSGLSERVANADVVVTAEGAFDAQSLMGKGTGAIAALACSLGKPCICIAGSVALGVEQVPWSAFRSYAITPQCASFEQAMQYASDYLEHLAARAASDLG